MWLSKVHQTSHPPILNILDGCSKNLHKEQFWILFNFFPHVFGIWSDTIGPCGVLCIAVFHGWICCVLGRGWVLWLYSVWCWHFWWDRTVQSRWAGVGDVRVIQELRWWWRLSNRRNATAISPVGFPFHLDDIGPWLPAHLLHSSNFVIALRRLYANHLTRLVIVALKSGKVLEMLTRVLPSIISYEGVWCAMNWQVPFQLGYDRWWSQSLKLVNFKPAGIQIHMNLIMFTTG